LQGEEGEMKGLFYASLILATLIVFTSCDASMEKYVPKDDTEKSIIDFLNSYLDDRNKGDVIKLASMFHDNGIYIAGDTSQYTKKEIAEKDPTWWTQYGEAKLSNLEIKINGDEATVSVTGKWGVTLKFSQTITLVKENGKWLFMKIKTG